MKDSRLIQVLQALTTPQWRALGLFLRSPYFNGRQDVTGLLGYLEECLHQLRIVPGKEEVARRFFPGEPYDAQRVRQLMSHLLQRVERFLAVEELLGEHLEELLALSTAYRGLRLPKHFQQTLTKIERQLEAHPWRSADYHRYQLQMQWESYQYSSLERRTGEQNLQVLSDHLDLSFLIRKLRQSCLLLAHRSVFPTDYDLGLLPAVLTFIEERKLAQYPAVAVYYQAYRALASPANEDHFQFFKERLLQHHAIFPPGERRDLFLLAINYCIRRLNDGAESYAHAGLELYRAGLMKGDLLIDGTLSRFAYRNIVAMGLLVGDHEATEQFIHDYRPYLDPLHRESMYSFCRARLAYHRGQHHQAVVLLQKAEYSDLLLNLAAKTLLMKIYFETGAHALLASHLEAMRNFLRRKRILGYHRRNYQNIIYYTNKLLAVNPYNKQEINTLKSRIEAEEVLTEKEWLLARLE